MGGWLASNGGAGTFSPALDVRKHLLIGRKLELSDTVFGHAMLLLRRFQPTETFGVDRRDLPLLQQRPKLA